MKWKLFDLFAFKDIAILSLDRCENFTKSTFFRYRIWRPEMCQKNQDQYHANVNGCLDSLKSHVIEHSMEGFRLRQTTHQSNFTEKSVFTLSSKFRAIPLMLIAKLHLHCLNKLCERWVNCICRSLSIRIGSIDLLWSNTTLSRRW